MLKLKLRSFREVCRNEFIIPLGPELKELYSDEEMCHSLRSLQTESVRPQLRMTEIAYVDNTHFFFIHLTLAHLSFCLFFIFDYISSIPSVFVLNVSHCVVFQLPSLLQSPHPTNSFQLTNRGRIYSLEPCTSTLFILPAMPCVCPSVIQTHPHSRLSMYPRLLIIENRSRPLRLSTRQSFHSKWFELL